jgi:hypothetical protein
MSKRKPITIAELQRNGLAFAEAAERNPWVHEWRAAALRAEAAGHDGPIKDFVRRFKQAEAALYPR